MLSASDIAIIQDEIVRGNRDAFRRIVRAYSLPLRSYLASYLHSLDDMDDLAQDVFLACFRNLSSFRRGENFSAWLRGIARNKLYEHLRRASRRQRAMDAFRADMAPVLESELERAVSDDRSESIEMLLRCIARLPEKLRQVVRAGLDGEKPANLAQTLGTSVAAIYTLHYRANQLLRACLHKEMG
jgi:RNA polymerase sigma-70 factor (ECF subfamily)